MHRFSKYWSQRMSSLPQRCRPPNCKTCTSCRQQGGSPGLRHPPGFQYLHTDQPSSASSTHYRQLVASPPFIDIIQLLMFFKTALGFPLVAEAMPMPRLVNQSQSKLARAGAGAAAGLGPHRHKFLGSRWVDPDGGVKLLLGCAALECHRQALYDLRAIMSHPAVEANRRHLIDLGHGKNHV